MKKGKISFVILIVMIITSFSIVFTEKKWEKESFVINHDVVSYYAYLPAAFIYKDLSLDFVYHRKENQNFLIWPERQPNGTSVIKTTMGVSYFYAPFFFIADAIASHLGYMPDGYSLPYGFMLVMCLTIYFSLSLIVLRAFLIRYFSDLVVALTLFSIVAGTNLLYYAIYDIPISHVFSFFLFSSFLLLTDNWYKRPTYVNSLLTGLTAGAIVLVRPIDILFILVFLFWGMSSFLAIKERFLFLLSRWEYVILIILAAVLIFLPQLIYWKVITGSLFVYSYGDEGFFWSSPHIIDGLFGFRNGWVLYSPTILFCLLGIISVKKYCKTLFIPMCVYIPLNIYVILSWWCWWYTGFGNRAFINSYPILSVVLACVLSWCFKQKKVVKFTMLALIVMSIGLSIYNTVLYYSAAIHYNAMTKSAYLQSFQAGKSTGPYWGMLRVPDHEKAKISSETSYLDQRNKDFSLFCDVELVDSVNQKLLSSNEIHQLEGYINITHDVVRSGENAIKLVNDSNGGFSYKFQVFKDEVYKCTVFRKSGSGSGVLGVRSSLESMPFTGVGVLQSDGWEKLELVYKVTHPLDYQEITFFVSNSDSSEVYFDDFSIERIDGTTISCDLEQLTADKKHFINDKGDLFFDVSTLDSVEFLSGSKSVKINHLSPFSLEHKFFVSSDMEIEISVWRKSETQSGLLVLCVDGGVELAVSNEIIETKDGWGKIQIKYTVPNEFDNVRLKVFVFNPDSVDAYFDDIETKFVFNDKNLW